MIISVSKQWSSYFECILITAKVLGYKHEHSMRVQKHTYTILSVILLLASAAYIALPKHAQAATTFTVTSTTDDVDSPDNNPGDGVCASDNVGNPCTLRAAIEEANALAGADTIEFNITPLDGSVKTIAPNSQLPDITSQLTIDGYTQDPTVSEPNSAVAPAPFNGVLLVELSGENAGSPGINGVTIKLSCGDMWLRKAFHFFELINPEIFN